MMGARCAREKRPSLIGYHIPPRDGAVDVGGNMERGNDKQTIDDGQEQEW